MSCSNRVHKGHKSYRTTRFIQKLNQCSLKTNLSSPFSRPPSIQFRSPLIPIQFPARRVSHFSSRGIPNLCKCLLLRPQRDLCRQGVEWPTLRVMLNPLGRCIFGRYRWFPFVPPHVPNDCKGIKEYQGCEAQSETDSETGFRRGREAGGRCCGGVVGGERGGSLEDGGGG